MIEVVSFGRFKSDSLKTSFDYYLKLANKKIQTVPIMLKEARNPRENEKIKNETALLKDSLETSGRFSVILDAAGELMDSLAFSQFINRGMSSGRHLRFHVGNYYGIPDSLKEKEYPLISLSMLTMSHELALVVLAEQIYRSGTILFGGSYHR